MAKRLRDRLVTRAEENSPGASPRLRVQLGSSGLTCTIRSLPTYSYFAHEIIGNLLSLEPRKWRKPRRLDRRENKARVADFRKKYDRYDWTKMLAQSSDQAEVEAGPSRF